MSLNTGRAGRPLALALGITLAIGAAAPFVVNSGLPSPQSADVDPDVVGTGGAEPYVVRFQEPSVVAAYPNLARQAQFQAQAAEYADQIAATNAGRLQAIESLGGEVETTLTHALNGAIVTMTPAEAAAARGVAGVYSVTPAGIFRAGQSVARPTLRQLIGATGADTLGFRGQNTVIAILDSGVDYTHAAFSGPGTRAYYVGAVAGAGPRIIGDTPGVFPNGPQVIGGYDWVGETWTGQAPTAANPGSLTITPDPDPIDNQQLRSDFAGHGTAVASAAAGQPIPAVNFEGGTAQAAKLLAFRACSRLSSACSGSGILNSIESSVRYYLGQPNSGMPGANNPALPAGMRMVMNLSLGAPFGIAAVDDTSEALRNAVAAGIVVVASAGNSADVPYINGTPGASEPVLSVAASQLAEFRSPALLLGAPVNTAYSLLPAAFGPSPLNPIVTTFGLAGPNRTAGNTTNLACSNPINLANPGPAVPAIPPLGGATGIADRGTCEFAEKALNIQRAGGTAALIVNNQAGVINIGLGTAGPLVTIPGWSMTLADGQALKNAVVANPDLTGTIVRGALFENVSGGVNGADLISDFSSRGVSLTDNRLKPEVTAPGTSIWLAAVGTGDQNAPISGTSFSAPLTAGAAAAVLSAFPTFTPNQVKAALMNTADPNVWVAKTGPSTGTLAPISRSGAGRIRVDRAVATGTLAWNDSDVWKQPALSFGYQPTSQAADVQIVRTVRVQNLGAVAKSYNVGVERRFANDAGKGVTFSTSVSSLVVPANSTGTFDVVATLNGASMPADVGTGSSSETMRLEDGGNPAKFTSIEQDGYVIVDGGGNDLVRLPYHMIPKRASAAVGFPTRGGVFVQNLGVAPTLSNVFTLAGVDPVEVDPPAAGAVLYPIDIKDVGFRFTPNVFPNAVAGVVRGDLLEVAVTLARPVTSLRMGTIWVDVDANRDGTYERSFAALNTTTNSNFAFIRTNPGGAFGNAFFATGGNMNGNWFVLTVFAELVGIAPGQQARFRVRAEPQFTDTGVTWDAAPDVGFYAFTPGTTVVAPSIPGYPAASIGFVSGAGTNLRLGYTVNPLNRAASPSDTGLLLLYQHNAAPATSTAVQVYR